MGTARDVIECEPGRRRRAPNLSWTAIREVSHSGGIGDRTIELGLDSDGSDLISAEGISADGLTIVGFGTNPSGDIEAWIAVIPEPSTALLLASGLAALAVGRRHMVA